jgi:hypothetical protein
VTTCAEVRDGSRAGRPAFLDDARRVPKGLVRELDLSGNGLTGVLPESLGKLVHLNGVRLEVGVACVHLRFAVSPPRAGKP